MVYDKPIYDSELVPKVIDPLIKNSELLEATNRHVEYHGIQFDSKRYSEFFEQMSNA